MFKKPKETFRKLNITDIPVGRENAISEKELRNLTGLDAKKLMRQINKIRKNHIIFSRSDGKGYYQPSVDARHRAGNNKRENNP